MTYDVGLLYCEVCLTASVKADKWSKIRAHDAGWYFQKDGRAYCPEHRPSYAPERSS